MFLKTRNMNLHAPNISIPSRPDEGLWEKKPFYLRYATLQFLFGGLYSFRALSALPHRYLPFNDKIVLGDFLHGLVSPGRPFCLALLLPPPPLGVCWGSARCSWPFGCLAGAPDAALHKFFVPICSGGEMNECQVVAMTLFQFFTISLARHQAKYHLRIIRVYTMFQFCLNFLLMLFIWKQIYIVYTYRL